MKKTIFIVILIILAASPVGILVHEFWHIGFSYFYGATPVALCVNFGGGAFASTMINVSEVTVDKCYIRFIDESVAYVITIGVTLLMVYIFTKKYINLLDKHKAKL